MDSMLNYHLSLAGRQQEEAIPLMKGLPRLQLDPMKLAINANFVTSPTMSELNTPEIEEFDPSVFDELYEKELEKEKVFKNADFLQDNMDCTIFAHHQQGNNFVPDGNSLEYKYNHDHDLPDLRYEDSNNIFELLKSDFPMHNFDSICSSEPLTQASGKTDNIISMATKKELDSYLNLPQMSSQTTNTLISQDFLVQNNTIPNETPKSDELSSTQLQTININDWQMTQDSTLQVPIVSQSLLKEEYEEACIEVSLDDTPGPITVTYKDPACSDPTLLTFPISTTITPKKRRGRPPKKYLRHETLSGYSIAFPSSPSTSTGRTRENLDGLSKEEKYMRIREQNNIASRKCRVNRKQKELMLEKQFHEETKKNTELQKKLSEMNTYCDFMKNLLYNKK